MKCNECPKKYCTFRGSTEDGECGYVDKNFSEKLSQLITNKTREQMEINEQSTVKPFYMVYVMGSGCPFKTYDNVLEAETEAKRLCNKEQKSAYVLKAILGYEFFSRIDEIKVED